MPTVQPYLIVPTLIEQPTWGGDYIASLKRLKSPKLKGKKLGQSYELYQHTLLSLETNSTKVPVALGNPASPQKVSLLGSGKPFTISNLIKTSPVKTLGAKAIKLHGNHVQILIKLTQAAGNSYQLHVKKPVASWQPKPESWYYLEPGLITLGVKPNIDWNQYQQVCLEVNQKAQDLSSQVQSKKLTIKEARGQLQEFIKNHNPQNYVNTQEVARHQAIDLSPCGIHHSWEENAKTHPQGNIIYEVQKNVYDPVSTIRVFDRGKIVGDGTIRPLNINDYFKYIDKSPEANNPQGHFTAGKVVKKTSTYTVRQIFSTPNYQMQQISLNKPVSNQHTTTSDSYHHLFAYQGSIKLKAATIELTLGTGYSAFVPASTGAYILTPLTKHATVLKTFL